MYIFQPDRKILEEQVKEYSKFIGGRVLDVGAGNFDRYSHHFDYKEYVKMDTAGGSNVDVVASVENIPFADEHFDSVICTQVLEHVKNPGKAVFEIYRVLKKGGVCLVSVPQTSELHEEPHDYFRYTKYGLTELFSGAGFKLVKISERGGFFTMMLQMKIRYLISRLNLYRHRILAGIISRFFYIGFIVCRFLDRKDEQNANSKHTIGWCAIFRK